MGPRIILRGAIPINSNIGGSGHRPLLGEVVSRFGLCRLLFGCGVLLVSSLVCVFS